MSSEESAIKLVPPEPVAPESQQDAGPAQPLPETADQARMRAAKCFREISAVLLRHRCRIAPYWENPEPVGTDGRRVQLTATYGVIPE